MNAARRIPLQCLVLGVMAWVCVSAHASRISEVFFDDPAGGWSDAVEVADVQVATTIELVMINARNSLLRGQVRQVVSITVPQIVVLISDEPPAMFPWEQPGIVPANRLAPAQLLADGWSLTDGFAILLFDGMTGLEPFDNVLTDPSQYGRLAGAGVTLLDWVALGGATPLAAAEIGVIGPARAMDGGDVLTVPVAPGTAAARVYENELPIPLWLAGPPVAGVLGLPHEVYPLTPGLLNPDREIIAPEPASLLLVLAVVVTAALCRQPLRV